MILPQKHNKHLLLAAGMNLLDVNILIILGSCPDEKIKFSL